MSNLLDNTTQHEKSFIWAVENNRGDIKNKEKFYPILVDIYENSTNSMREQLTKGKMIGIMNIQKFTDNLFLAEQEVLLKKIAEINKPSIRKITFEYDKILANRPLN